MIQRSFHLCCMPQFTQFERNFQARYDGKDMAMFKSPNFVFDIDDELDAMRKAQAFVAEVSRAHNYTQPTPSIVGGSNCLLAQLGQTEEEEKKEGGPPKIDNRKSRMLPQTERSSRSIDSLGGPAMARTISQ